MRSTYILHNILTLILIVRLFKSLCYSHTLRVWELDVENRKIRPTDVSMGQVKRLVKCIEVQDDDKYFYCGTSTGDIIAINMNTRLFQVNY